MEKSEFLSILDKSSELDKQTVLRAFEFAERAHANQLRDDGSPYITHPAAVAAILAKVGMDTPTVTAALLHDVAEDTEMTLAEISKEFGEEVAFFVDGVTKLAKMPFSAENPAAMDTIARPEKIETLRKMFLATARDIRVALIKLADRMHNMQTLGACAAEKQMRISKETMDIYAPLASRLGMGEWKGILEDLAFPYLYPKEYEWLTSRVERAYHERQAYIEKILPDIKALLATEGIVPVALHARPKHYWSLYQKLLVSEMDLSKIHDLVALRIIVETGEECYKALGVIHKHFTPLPGKIKDYIALPKGSGYRSLHTTVFCIDGHITEFQIRTAEMHYEAEFGIAAHWLYKEKGRSPKKKDAPGIAKNLSWIGQLQAWQKAAKGSKEFLEALKLEFLRRRIFVFTPKGDVIDLPAGATAVDFSYAIHSEVGHRCTGAKSDGRIIPLSAALENGSVVEILTRKELLPNRDWLLFVKTIEAKKKITAWFNAHRSAALNLKKEGVSGAADAAMQPQIKIKKPALLDHNISVVAGENMRNVLTRVAKCCSPLPGDEIDGYITLQGGIAVHKRGCASLRRAKDPQRRIPVSWGVAKGAKHPATVKVRGRARVGLVRDASEVISKSGVNILSLTAYDTPDGEGVLNVTLEVAGKKELADIMAKLRMVKNVFSVEQA
jgi:GTP diphosphokinase / guanosine-3',5'-bis(diphosphate) 3'-diphosphatase